MNNLAEARPTEGAAPMAPADDADYWNCLIDERAAAAFLGLSARTLQQFRQRGGGPRFVRISARCVKYRRHDLDAWATARLRCSTADPGPGAARGA